MAKSKLHIGIKNDAAASTLELHFTDFIYDGFDWNSWEETNLVQDTIDTIKAAAPTTIKIVINSLGGDVMIGLALYNYLKNYKAEKEVEIIGFAASIASVMAMCASPGKLKMAKNSFMIIHAAWSWASGNAAEIRKQADTLDTISSQLADIYAQRSGESAKYYTDLWAGGDVWFTGEECIEEGLVDELFNGEPVQARADIKEFGFKNVPQALLRTKAQKKNTPESHSSFFSDIKNEFMNLFETMKASISGAKENKKFAKIQNRDEILEMIEATFKPVAEKFDEHFPEQEEEETDLEEVEEKPKAKTKVVAAAKKETAPAAGKKSAEKPAAAAKKVVAKAAAEEEADEEDVEEVDEVDEKKPVTANAKKLAALQKEMEDLKAAIAAGDSTPGKDKSKSKAAAVGVNVSYED